MIQIVIHYSPPSSSTFIPPTPKNPIYSPNPKLTENPYAVIWSNPHPTVLLSVTGWHRGHPLGGHSSTVGVALGQHTPAQPYVLVTVGHKLFSSGWIGQKTRRILLLVKAQVVAMAVTVGQAGRKVLVRTVVMTVV